MYIDYMETPLGKLEIRASEQGLTRVWFCETESKPPQTNRIITLCKQQLTEYFNGRRQTFSLPIEQNGTDFQKSVWDYLQSIPFGKTASYGDVAKGLNNPKAVRAVGAANGKNPIGIIVPCHRVIGSNGTLTGYAGGMDRKKWLLEHEEKYLREF